LIFLLFPSRGPAFPNYFLIEKYAPGLEDYFTVCYWEQRVGGLSYTSKELPVQDSVSDIVYFYKSPLRDKSMHELGIGTMRNMKSVFSGVFIPVWMCKAYTLQEKMKIWESKFSFVRKTKLIDELFSTDIPTQVPELKIPVYFFSGKYDLTVNKDLARAYLNKLKAQVKGFYLFSESAYSPLFEEPATLREIIIKDVLNGKNDLADTF
jgi:hypothetical protein